MPVTVSANDGLQGQNPGCATIISELNLMFQQVLVHHSGFRNHHLRKPFKYLQDCKHLKHKVSFGSLPFGLMEHRSEFVADGQLIWT